MIAPEVFMSPLSFSWKSWAWSGDLEFWQAADAGGVLSKAAQEA